MRSKQILICGLLLCLAVTSGFADVKIKSRMTVQGFSVDSTTYIKGNMQRNETSTPYGGGSTYSIYQCDKQQMVQVSAMAQSYYVTALGEGGSASTAAATGKKSGGEVVITAKMTETGEKKKILGYDARHVIVDVSVEPGPGACTPKSNIKQDLWFIDLPVMAGCANNPREFARMRTSTNECGDTEKFKLVGNVKPGYPAEMQMTMDGPNGQPMTIRREAVDISTSSLDASLFEIPAGYRQVSGPREMMAGGAGMGRGGSASGYGAPSSSTPTMPTTGSAASSGTDNCPAGYRPTTPDEARAYSDCMRQKYAGQIAAAQQQAGQANAGRTMPSGMNMPTARPRIALVIKTTGGDSNTFLQYLGNSLNNAGYEPMPLQGMESASLSTQDAAAKQAGCEYLLVTETTAKQSDSAKKKLGGMLRGEADVNTTSFEANSVYRLYKVGDPSARLNSNAQINSASTATDSLRMVSDKEAASVIALIGKR